jgi:hypothetical protein
MHTEPTDDSPLDFALSYAEAGWAVMPLWWAVEGVCACREGAACRRPAKHPRCSGGLASATTEPSIIREWWRRWPEANVGVATGSRSGGLWVLDVDGAQGGRTLVELVATHGHIGWTLEVHTGGGGAHFYFDGSALPGVPTSAGRLGPGLDVRGEGGYVVAPPSIHASGYAYQWCNGRDVEPAPPWLVALTVPSPANDAPELGAVEPTTARGGAGRVSDLEPADVERRAAAYLRALPPAISGAGGHGATYAAALALVRGFGLDAATALQLLFVHFNPRCSPPWSRAELQHKVRSAAASTRTGTGYLLAGKG